MVLLFPSLLIEPAGVRQRHLANHYRQLNDCAVTFWRHAKGSGALRSDEEPVITDFIRTMST